MSTKNTTTSSNNTAFQFDPSSLAAYQKNLSTFMPILQNFAKNPFNNEQYNMDVSEGQNNAARIGGRGVSNILNNAAAMGYGTSGGAFNSMLAAAGRQTGSLQAQAARSAIQNAGQRQMSSLGMLSAFQPLMTGSSSNGTQTQSTSGLGTWLPQLIGAGLGAAGSFASMGAGGPASIGQGASKINPPLQGSPVYGGVIGGYSGMNPGNMNSLNGLMAPSYRPSAYGYGT